VLNSALAVLADNEAACANGRLTVSQHALSNLAEYDPALAEVAELVGSVQAELSEAISTLAALR
jgi:DNA repair protein RecN (Recombination protein N)